MVRPIVSFYSGTARDSSGRSLEDILKFDSDELERTHDFIQWLFPLREPSKFNSSAPLLDDRQIATFRNDEKLREQLLKSFDLMLKFYGFRRRDDDIERGDNWVDASRKWLTPGNHNYLRITRILKSLCVLGLDDRARSFLIALEDVYSESSEVIGQTTHAYWKDAARDRS